MTAATRGRSDTSNDPSQLLEPKRYRYDDVATRIAEEGKKRVVDPKPFDGVDYGAYLVFMRACERVFEIRKETYSADRDRVLYASSHLTGGADAT